MGTQNLTLQPGVPVLLTENAGGPDLPLTIISPTVGAATVWVSANDSSIAAAVPVVGGTSLPWTSTGIVYATVVDPSAQPVEITVTDEIGSWQPPTMATPPALDTWSITGGSPPTSPSVATMTQMGTDCTWGGSVVMSVQGTTSKQQSTPTPSLNVILSANGQSFQMVLGTVALSTSSAKNFTLTTTTPVPRLPYTLGLQAVGTLNGTVSAVVSLAPSGS